MYKCLVLLFMIVGVTACTQKDAQYYRLNPKELQTALKACPDKEPSGISCKDLEALGMRLNQLAYQLQMNPPGFGKKILALQELIAQQKIESAKPGATDAIRASLAENKQNLKDYLAVVKWLESPES